MVGCGKCGADMNYLDHGVCPRCGAHCGCSFSPASASDYCSRHRPKTNSESFKEKAKQTVQNEFERKAKDLIIARQYGPFAGRMDAHLTELLQKVFVYRDGEVDWVLTYETRLQAQEGHYKSEQQKRDRR